MCDLHHDGTAEKRARPERPTGQQRQCTWLAAWGTKKRYTRLACRWGIKHTGRWLRRIEDFYLTQIRHYGRQWPKSNPKSPETSILGENPVVWPKTRKAYRDKQANVQKTGKVRLWWDSNDCIFSACFRISLQGRKRNANGIFHSGDIPIVGDTSGPALS